MALGLVLLVGGADVMVRGGSRLAARLGISPLVIGLTVVAIGTSAPELVVGIDASFRGSSALAVGNIVGTNLVNILLILGLSAAIRAVVVESRTVRFDVPWIGLAATALLIMGIDGQLGRWEGVVLVAGGVAYTVMVIRTSQRERASVSADISAPGLDIRERRGGPYRDAAELVIGIGIIVVGGDLLVDGAVQLAKALGVTEALIGLTVIAIGTSAPELATVIVSTIRGDRSIAVGNLLGSSVYNIVFILGVTMTVSPAPMEVPEPVRQVDLILMTAVALACIPIFRRGHRLSRPEGVAFVAAYLLYLGYLLVVRT